MKSFRIQTPDRMIYIKWILYAAIQREFFPSNFLIHCFVTLDSLSLEKSEITTKAENTTQFAKFTHSLFARANNVKRSIHIFTL